MKTIEIYTSKNFLSKSGKLFNIYVDRCTEYVGLKSKLGCLIYTIRDEQGNEICSRKSKKTVENFLAKN